MKNTKKLLEMYEKWSVVGKIDGGNGLCGLLEGYPEFEYFIPTHEERGDLSAYWASGITNKEWKNSPENRKIAYEVFTSDRQNIVLLLAAINGEL